MANNNEIVINSDVYDVTVTEASLTPNQITISTDTNDITVTQAVTTVVQVAVPGPKGDTGAAADLTALNAFTGSIQTQVNNLAAHTGSYATTGSNVFVGNQTITGSLTTTDSIVAVSVTASVFGTASWALNAATASYINPLNQNLVITGALLLTASYINEVSYIDFATGSAVPAWHSGRVYWDNTAGALSVYNAEADISLQIGQENYLRARNQTGTLITNGTVVRILGAIGDRPSITPAQSVNETQTFSNVNDIIGMATHDIEHGTDGYITTFGTVNGVDTSKFNAGDLLWVSQSAGLVTNVAPLPPYDKIFVGVVTRANANNGSIFISPREATHFHDLSDVSASAYTQGDLWVYSDGNSGFWKNTKQLSGSYTLIGNLAVTGSIFGTSSYALTASYAANVPLTASYALSALSASYSTTSTSASYSLSASYSTRTTSASYAATSSYAPNYTLLGTFNTFTSSYTTGSFTGSFKGTLTGTASWASNAITASYALNASVTFNTGSFVTTSSFNAFTASYTTGSFTGSLTGTASYAVNSTNAISASYYGGTVATASYAITASYVLNSISSSYSTSALSSSYASTATLAPNYTLTSTFNSFTSSYATGSFTGSFTGVHTGNLIGTASWASNAVTASYVSSVVSSSYAATASYILNAVSSSYATTASYSNFANTSNQASTASYLNTLNQNLTFNGNLTLNGTASITYLNVQYETASVIYSSGSNQFGDAANDIQTLWGTVTIPSGSLQVTGSITATSVTSSLFGTASYATTAGTALSGNGIFSGSFSGSFTGNGAGLTNIPASVITGLNLSQIATGSVTASVSTGTGSFTVVSGSTNIFYVGSNGNIGIGTTTPVAKLEVVNPNGGDSDIAAQFVAGLYSRGLRIGAYNSEGAIYSFNTPGGGGTRVLRVDNGGGNTYFGPSDEVTATGGKVGIGNTSPAFKLDVNGSGRFTSNLTITGSVISTTGFTGSLQGTSSWSTNAISASYYNGSVVSASYADTSSLTLLGVVTASAVNTTITFTKGNGTTFDVTLIQSGSVASASFATYAATALSASYTTTASYTLFSSNTISASYAGTASVAPNYTLLNTFNTFTSSYNTGSFSGSFVGTLVGTSSWALNSITASYALNASVTFNTGSFVTTSSFNTFTGSYNTGSFTGSFIGSLLGTASYAVNSTNAISASYYGGSVVSASYAATASYIINAVSSSYSAQSLSSSYSLTASYYGGLVTSASYASTASYVVNSVSASYATTASYAVTASYYGGTVVSASYAGTASVAPNYTLTSTFNSFTASYTTGSFTGSFTGVYTGTLTGTASWSINSVSASFAGTALTAPNYTLTSTFNTFTSSYTTGSFTGSFVGIHTGNLIGTASWASNAVTASYYGGTVTSASYANTASYALAAQTLLGSVTSASYALTASYVNTLNQNVLITGSLTVGATTLGANENTLVLGPAPAGGTGEGGQILLAAQGGTYTSASMWDNYQNSTRLLRGTNAGSDAVVASFNMGTKQLQFPAYNGTAAFPGTVAAYLAVDNNGNVLTASGSGGGGLTGGSANYIARWVSSIALTTGSLWDNGTSVGVGNQSPSYKLDVSGDIRSTGAVYANANGTMYFRGGDDAELWDVNIANTVGLYGQQDATVGSLKLGSGGGILSGKSGSIGIGTTNPTLGTLQVNGNVYANSYTGSLFGTSSWASNVLSSSYAATASYVSSVVSSSFASTASYYRGIVTSASYAATASYVNPLVQDVRITGALYVSGTTKYVSVNTPASSSALNVYKSGSTVIDIQGSQGQLFSVADSLSGSLMSVNDISGLPILEVFSDNTVKLGSFTAPAVYTTKKTVSTVGANTLYTLNTGSYDAVFMDYIVKSGSNARAGQFMALQNSGLVTYTETTTTDFGSTTGVTFGANISGANLIVSSSTSTATWTIKTILRAI